MSKIIFLKAILVESKGLFLTLLLGLILGLLCFSAATGLAREVLIQEDFETLDAWEFFTFKNIEQKTRYEIVTVRGESLLKASSNSSASALVHKTTFDVYRFPLLSWRWKVEQVYERGNAAVKQGDDYPLRVYVLFKYDPDQAGLAKRLKYALAIMNDSDDTGEAGVSYLDWIRVEGGAED